ncbi:hypothetical protein AAMO2058_000681300 [Amorphochlora amoebiformis]
MPRGIAGSVRACQRREKRKAAQSGCIKSPLLKKIKTYNLRIRYHEQDHVKVSKAKKLINQGVLDPGFILQLQHTARNASYRRGVGWGYTEEAHAWAGQRAFLTLLDAAFTEDSEVNTLGRDPKRTLNDNPYAPTSININGRKGSQFFREIPKIAAGMFNGCRDVKELLILVHLQVCITIRDIIGRVMVENDWKPSAETGRRWMNLVLAVFGKERVQPYVFAIFIELPIQLKLHQARCRKPGIRADTTALNAQNSEHVDKILKEIDHTQSAHVRSRHTCVIGIDSLV